LAWSPFPLGGAISWGAGLQEILVALCWIVWVAYSATSRGGAGWSGTGAVIVPLVLAVLVLAWAGVQMLPGVPLAWIHPVWTMTSEALGRPVQGAISLNPWRTQAEILKLSSYVMACWLAFRLARRHETAAALLNAIIVICAAYALYAFVLTFTGFSQTELFYITPLKSTFVTGPFVLHNSFATYSGLGALAAVVKLFSMGSQSIAAERGGRQLALTILQFCFGARSLRSCRGAADVFRRRRLGLARRICRHDVRSRGAGADLAASESARRCAGCGRAPAHWLQSCRCSS